MPAGRGAVCVWVRVCMLGAVAEAVLSPYWMEGSPRSAHSWGNNQCGTGLNPEPGYTMAASFANPARIKVQDGSAADATNPLSSNLRTAWLEARNFDFSSFTRPPAAYSTFRGAKVSTRGKRSYCGSPLTYVISSTVLTTGDGSCFESASTTSNGEAISSYPHPDASTHTAFDSTSWEVLERGPLYPSAGNAEDFFLGTVGSWGIGQYYYHVSGCGSSDILIDHIKVYLAWDVDVRVTALSPSKAHECVAPCTVMVTGQGFFGSTATCHFPSSPSVPATIIDAETLSCTFPLDGQLDVNAPLEVSINGGAAITNNDVNFATAFGPTPLWLTGFGVISGVVSEDSFPLPVTRNAVEGTTVLFPADIYLSSAPVCDEGAPVMFARIPSLGALEATASLAGVPAGSYYVCVKDAHNGVFVPQNILFAVAECDGTYENCAECSMADGCVRCDGGTSLLPHAEGTPGVECGICPEGYADEGGVCVVVPCPPGSVGAHPACDCELEGYTGEGGFAGGVWAPCTLEACPTGSATAAPACDCFSVGYSGTALWLAGAWMHTCKVETCPEGSSADAPACNCAATGYAGAAQWGGTAWIHTCEVSTCPPGSTDASDCNCDAVGYTGTPAWDGAAWTHTCEVPACPEGSVGAAPSCDCDASGYTGTAVWSGSAWTHTCTVPACPEGSVGAAPSCDCDASGYTGTAVWSGSAWTHTCTGSTSGAPTSGTGDPQGIADVQAETTDESSDSVLPVVLAVTGSLCLCLVVAVAVVIIVTSGRGRRSHTAKYLEDSDATLKIDNSSFGNHLLAQIEKNPPFAKGGFGTIHKIELEDGAVAALKVLSENVSEAARMEFHREATVLTKLSVYESPLIIGLLCFSENPMCFGMEYAEKGPLSEAVAQNPLSGKELEEMASMTARPLAFLHGKGFVHLDVKASNYLILGDDRVVLCDFGLTVPVEECLNDSVSCGTPQYLSPERYHSVALDSTCSVLYDPRKSDVYSWAVLVAVLTTGKVPFSKFPPSNVPEMVAKNGLRPPLKDGAASAWLEELVGQAWGEEVEGRPTMEEVVAVLEEEHAD